MTNKSSNIDIWSGPSKQKDKALGVTEREKFYQAAKELTGVDLEVALCGRVLMDFGLRNAELSHCTQEWIKRKKHPKTGSLSWCIEVPDGERCTTGAGPRSESKDSHTKGKPCWACRTRAYGDKDWVDDEFHEQYPFHPKSAASFRTVTWALPTESCRETAQLLHDYLAPGRQFQIGTKRILKNVGEIAEKADLNRHVTAHALRHTYGMRLAAAEKTLNDIMNQMRHANVSMARYYSNQGGTDTLDAIQRDWKANESF